MSIIAAVLSITAFVRCEPMEFDAVALLASIISIPVAVFAITQAINFLWYENKVKEGINELSRELKRILEGLKMICVWQFVHIIY